MLAFHEKIVFFSALVARDSFFAFIFDESKDDVN